MIRKAIIPLAGAATRMYPWARALPKAMLPLPYEGKVLPIFHHICLEAESAEIEEILLVVSPRDREMISRYAEYMRESSCPISARIEIIEQACPAGFGDAVLQGERFVGESPFLLLLGDHVYRSENPDQNCVRQVVSAWERYPGVAMIGVQPVSEDTLSSVGAYKGGLWDDRIYLAQRFIEKPDLELARRKLVTPDLPEGEYLAHCGIYVLAPDIFNDLRTLAGEESRGAELSLADAQQKLLAEQPGEYRLCRIAGCGYDTGNPAAYSCAFAEFIT